MATSPRTKVDRKIEYPTSDGKPMAETETHRDDMMDLIRTLQRHYADDPDVCVSGNLLMFYEEGNKHRHLSPDVFVVFGVPKRTRLNYLVWEEGKGPDLVIELTSKTTKSEDQKKKRDIYRDILKVPEYFLFDPTEDYLRPSMQGFRRVGDQYEPIEPVAGRLPSAILGLHLERDGLELRLHDPQLGRRLPTPSELLDETEAARRREEAARRREEAARRQAEAALRQEEATRRQAVEENERLRGELEELRRRLIEGS